ncbi:MAG: arylsulfatase [Planctomycetota bacterium]
MMNRAGLLWIVVFAFTVSSPAIAGGGRASNKPNVVIFLADDQGWGDLSLHGNKDLSTPHLDSLARDGVQFDRFYVCAVCAPTRAEFLTGRYHPRTGVYGVSRGAERMNLDERTIAEAFQEAGYATGCFGKWHNGMQYPYHPRGRGFDTFLGYCSGHWGDYFDAELERNGAYFKSDGYITDVVTTEAITFIETNAKENKPFFCFVPLPTPHSPMQVPDEYWNRHKDKTYQMSHKRLDAHTRAAMAMVENIDDNVGRVLKKLDDHQLVDNTIVVYFSDNGPNGPRWNGGMRGIKGSVDEGGVRSAMFVRWPGMILSGHRVESIARAIDLMPTLLDLAMINRLGNKPLDGQSLKEELTNPQAEWIDRHVYSRQGNKIGLRVWQYRLDDKGRLYHMFNDPGQTTNIAAQKTEITELLRQKISAWRRDVGLDQKPERRPFTVGHPDWPVTELPARDATTKGGIKRSSIHPNCSYFLNWKATEDAIVWDAEVLTAGRYEALVYYACPEKDLGATIELRFGDAKTSSKVTQAHDPPLEGERENRIYRKESFTKAFKPMSLGVIELQAGRAEMSLHATDIPGEQALEFRRLMLRRVSE